VETLINERVMHLSCWPHTVVQQFGGSILLIFWQGGNPVGGTATEPSVNFPNLCCFT
jgi:hypothetical protein